MEINDIIMFIISHGIPKSGSTLLMIYAEKLIKYGIEKNGQLIFQEWIKNGPVGGIENFAFDKWPQQYQELIKISNDYGPFVIKTHLPKEYINDLILIQTKTIYSIRDPRDILLSLIDHAIRSKRNGETFFSDIDNFDSALSIVKDWCKTAIKWFNSPSCEIFRYEDLILKTKESVCHLAEFLNIPYNSNLIQKIISEEKSQREYGKNQFNKGLVIRYLDEMDSCNIEKCNNELGDFIITLGYKI